LSPFNDKAVSIPILKRVLKLAEMLDFVGAKPPQNQVLRQSLELAFGFAEKHQGLVDFSGFDAAQSNQQGFEQGDFIGGEDNHC
jgi:hypothetical protein